LLSKKKSKNLRQHKEKCGKKGVSLTDVIKTYTQVKLTMKLTCYTFCHISCIHIQLSLWLQVLGYVSHSASFYPAYLIVKTRFFIRTIW